MINTYRAFTTREQNMWMYRLLGNITDGFDEAVNETVRWLESPQATDFFFKQRGQLNTFFKESGIQDRWQDIIDDRAKRGADITAEIYEYARSVNMTDHLVEYTRTERAALNRLCDYNYELIRNVTNDEITAIRRSLVQDYAEGNNPRQSHLRELALEPINGFSPAKRAEMIARTESARTLNMSTLETMRADGVQYVVLYGCNDDCDICGKYTDEEHPVSIDDALDIGVPHPNCHGTWIVVADKDTGLYTVPVQD